MLSLLGLCCLHRVEEALSVVSGWPLPCVPSRRYCKCELPYNPDRPMVMCDACEVGGCSWFRCLMQRLLLGAALWVVWHDCTGFGLTDARPQSL